MANKEDKRYYVVDHANKRADQQRSNPNRGSVRRDRSGRVASPDKMRHDEENVDK